MADITSQSRKGSLQIFLNPALQTNATDPLAVALVDLWVKWETDRTSSHFPVQRADRMRAKTFFNALHHTHEENGEKTKRTGEFNKFQGTDS